jgi:hypothetical protein
VILKVCDAIKTHEIEELNGKALNFMLYKFIDKMKWDLTTPILNMELKGDFNIFAKNKHHKFNM